MAISGITGFSFFVIANCTNMFVGANVLAACIQLIVNAFVFTVGVVAFGQSHGRKKALSVCWVIVPIFMASVTIWRVLRPALFP